MQIRLHLPNEGKKLLCHEGDNVRQTLLRHGVSPYRGLAKIFNCRGHGLCTRCRVQIEPAHHVVEADLTPVERAKLADAPGWRLACQLHAIRDLVVWTQPGRPAGAEIPREVLPHEQWLEARRKAAELRGSR